MGYAACASRGDKGGDQCAGVERTWCPAVPTQALLTGPGAVGWRRVFSAMWGGLSSNYLSLATRTLCGHSLLDKRPPLVVG